MCFTCAVCDSYGQARKQVDITDTVSNSKIVNLGLVPRTRFPGSVYDRSGGARASGYFSFIKSRYLLKTKNTTHATDTTLVTPFSKSIYIFHIYILFPLNKCSI